MYRFKKTRLEKQIIGCCLLHNCFHIAASIISTKNFSGYQNHNAIWATMEKLYLAGKPVTLSNYNNSIPLLHSERLYIIESTCEVTICPHEIKKVGLVLLEADIREKVIKDLIMVKSRFQDNNEYSKCAVFQEMIEFFEDPYNDLISSLDIAIDFISSYESLQDQLETVKMYRDLIPKKAEMIKEQYHINNLFRMLENLSAYKSQERSIIIRKCADIVKCSLMVKELPTNLMSDITKIQLI